MNGEGSQAARKNDKETKGLQKDEIDNTSPGADKVFCLSMILLDFMVFQYSFQKSIDRL